LNFYIDPLWTLHIQLMSDNYSSTSADKMVLYPNRLNEYEEKIYIEQES
jgi:hypothetical protein